MMHMKRFLKKRILIPFIISGATICFLGFKNDFFELAKQIEIFTSMYKIVNQNYVEETNPGQVMDVAIKGMLKELDPYTVFFNEQDVLKYKINNTGEYTGIGALINRKEGLLIIKEVYENMPADKAGFKAGDIITQIGDVNLKDFKEDASQLLKGAKNTKVEVTYLRNNQERKGAITLDEVEIKAVPYYKLLNNNIGYIVLSKFNEKASAETKAALLELKEKGAKKIILDLRDNPGGLLHEAVNICNLFVGKDEVIVTTKSKNKVHDHTYKTKNEPIDTEIPLVVIVNERSASASEIVSGALQDLDRAVIVGNRSFGKGLVQRPFNLAYGTQVKVTISKYYTPSGRCIQATDYSKKDENGKPIKTSEKDFNAFKTKKGRTVYDGGGVLPDIVISEMKKADLVRTIDESDALFNFTTKLYQKYQAGKMPSEISDFDFNEFKTYIKTQKIDLNTASEKSYKILVENLKKENIDTELSNELKLLEAGFERAKDKEINKYKEAIKHIMFEELIIRMGYRKAFYDHVSSQYKDVQSAIQVLNNLTQYNQILNK